MDQRPSPPFPRALMPALHAFTRLHRFVYRSTGGRIGRRMTGSVTSLLLHTTGRRSGERRTVALAYTEDGDSYLVVASNFGQERPPAWLLNLQADPHAELNVGRRRLPVTAHIVMPGADDYERLLSVASRATHDLFERYRASTAREIPVVRLVPDRH